MPGAMGRSCKNTPAARERELFKYYLPDESPSYDVSNVDARKSSSDPIMTAFAQLGALRLKAERGVITLSTGCREWIIAESGQSLSLQQDNDETDKLWHGVGVLKTVGCTSSPTDHLVQSGEDLLVINDMSKEKYCQELEHVKNEPYLRFSTTVALRTPQGVIIGTYGVLGTTVRDGLSASEKQFMLDMGITVMDYLQSGLMKRRQHRAETMVKAMGLFVEGKSSLREWWLERGHKGTHGLKKRNAVSKPVEQLADEEFGVQDTTHTFTTSTLDAQTGAPRPSLTRSTSSVTPSTVDVGDGRPSLTRSTSSFEPSSVEIGDGRPMRSGDASSTVESSGPFERSASSQHGRQSSITTADSGTDEPPQKPQMVSFDSSTSVLPPPVSVSKELQEAVLSGDLRSVFARASNLIREAIGVEGVLYYDASVGSFGGSVDRSVMDEKAPGAFKLDHSSGDDAITKGKVSGESQDKTASDSAHATSASEAEAPHEKNCNILGFSTRTRSSLKAHPTIEDHRTFPESVLRRMLKKYPHGKVFNFDQEGLVTSDSDPSSSNLDTPGVDQQRSVATEKRSRVRRASKEADAKAILKALPGARSVFFFPLWDSSRDRWFSGSFIWSTSPTRILCPTEDLTYLASFSNSVMAEVARISAQVLAQMKTDFISSISHELRSPLHGVLASVEFLQETEMDEVQTDMVNNIHASGKVLLDTINHVLDFSKVNRKSKVKNQLSGKSSKRFRMAKERTAALSKSPDETSNICVLSEEVIESIFAGHRVQKHAFGSNTDRHLSVAPVDAPVSVIVDITWRPNWVFDIESGAWRRILMNLFSNSLKYTKSGFIKISLDVEEDIASIGKRKRSNLILKVTDSGKGISQEFLRHQLYKPFKQEDSLSSGSGLGLSITRHIIQDLGGHIELTSEQGTGTEATVKIPLPAQGRPAQLLEPDHLTEVKEQTMDFKFGLEGFERYPDITEEPTGILSSDVEAAMYLRAVTITVLTTWFGMKTSTTSAQHGATNDADIVMIMEAGLGKRSLDDVLEPYCKNRKVASKRPIAIALCSSYHPTIKSQEHPVFDIFHLQQPYGPHKLAEILHKVLCRKGSIVAKGSAQALTTSAPQSTPPLITTDSSEQKPAPSVTFSPLPAKDDSQPQHFEVLPTGLWTKHAPVKSFGNWSTTNGELQDTPKPPKPLKSPPTPPYPTNGLRVLLVEDNEINLRLLVAYMRKLKLDYSTAVNGLEALNAYKDQKGKYDVIFMDISMPIMDGIESSKNIRRYEREASLPPVALIALTGAANPNTRQEAFSSGVDLFLTKPVPMKNLKIMLEDLSMKGREGLTCDGFQVG